jgi:aminoglycoside phosphotransferase (APT) family kinase protein
MTELDDNRVAGDARAPVDGRAVVSGRRTRRRSSGRQLREVRRRRVGAPSSGDEFLDRVQVFLDAEAGCGAPMRIDGLTRIGAGRSRENFVFDAVWREDGREVREPMIVRRDPRGGLLETDRGVEFTVLRALEATDVPAPRARWLDATGEWLGRPSLVMRREPGVCDYFVVNGDRPGSARLRLAERFCDLLAQVHLVDWETAGMGAFLDDPGPSAAIVELDRWEAVLRRDQLEAYPELELAMVWLRDSAPRSPATVLVHGDFKPGNVLLEGDEITALLDWELAHLGDPMEDLGWVTQPLRVKEHLIPGVWERRDLFERYARATGFEVDETSVAWWSVFASYKTAVMQVSGLRAFVEGRCDTPYQPTAAVLRTLLDSIAF